MPGVCWGRGKPRGPRWALCTCGQTVAGEGQLSRRAHCRLEKCDPGP